jgi:hypothetical protein
MCVVLLALVASCGVLEPQDQTGSAGRADAGKKKWTILIDFSTHVSDQQLITAVQANLRELRSVDLEGGNVAANIVVQYHRPGAVTNSAVKDVRMVLPSRPKERPDPNDELDGFQDKVEFDAKNTGDPATLTDFLTWGITNYRADHYVVFLHGHGLAWLGFGTDERFGSTTMKLAQLSNAFGAARAATGTDRFDLVMFDACLLNTIEVASEMRQHARYMVASETVEIAAGQPYGRIMKPIAKSGVLPDSSRVLSIMTTMVNEYVRKYSGFLHPDAPESDAALTLMGLDLDKVGNLNLKLRALALALRRLPNHGLRDSQIKNILDDADMTTADDDIKSADLYQLLIELEAADFASDEVRKAAADVRAFMGYPDGYGKHAPVKVRSPNPAKVMFGIAGWGKEKLDVNDPSAIELDADQLGVPGVHGKFPVVDLHPSKHGNGYVYKFRPWGSKVLEFDWVLLSGDGKTVLGKPQSVTIKHDFDKTLAFQVQNPQSPLVVEGHTHGYYYSGSQLVHGMGIFFGTANRGFTDYRKNVFVKESGWDRIFCGLVACAEPQPGE